MAGTLPTIAVLGASGLIGGAVADTLAAEGFPVVAIARRFTLSQRERFGSAALEQPIVDLDGAALARLIETAGADIVVNCIGVLQDGPRGGTDAVHRAFAARLAAALASRGGSLLVHLSVPGRPEDDPTPFSRSKRAAEQAIADAGIPCVILRPAFVLAAAAYGGSALMRALAMLPVALPRKEAASAFVITDIDNIAATIAIVARRWADGERRWNATWDVMTPEPLTVGDVVAGLRRRLGGPDPHCPLPGWLLRCGAGAGDAAAGLGWSPPMRSTALRELRRGVTGDPAPWMAATGIAPTPFPALLQRLAATVQEKWFARLYLLKALAIMTLVVFWAISGLIALTVAFGPATGILTAHGFPPQLAAVVTVASSLLDIGIGICIAFRRTCRIGLIAGIGVSLFYMLGAAAITPELWIEPLGALVKTGPAIVLMLVALAILEER
ncbi:SDR family oxidoreductase [Desertibaculum subflavum]|uniref:SDR family oxidoreductase n=1 Tax=Desertibaculum subflavum TaxID=2268458 RepID=UPI000E665FF2